MVTLNPTEVRSTQRSSIPRLTERWPTILGLIVSAGAIAAILRLDVDEAASTFGPGAAAMTVIYLAAFVSGKPAFAWPAFGGVVAAAALQSVLDVEGAIGMTALLGLMWFCALSRRRAQDTYWFNVETLGLVVFGGLTIAALLTDARLAGILAGVGWLTHGLWDIYHFAQGRVVTRTWSELCAVTDIPVGAMLIVTSILR